MHQHIFFETPAEGTGITDNSSVYHDCVLTHALGEYPAGTEVGQIRVNYKEARITWRDDGKLIAFSMKAVQMGGK